ncbi:hypothetical protein F4859DRAFT_247625 [Xylaria cf. heliscus]|nr:hypothetical protein F4859DRAFT_247625 [Xylaria cf. heliscus]
MANPSSWLRIGWLRSRGSSAAASSSSLRLFPAAGELAVAGVRARTVLRRRSSKRSRGVRTKATPDEEQGLECRPVPTHEAEEELATFGKTFSANLDVEETGSKQQTKSKSPATLTSKGLLLSLASSRVPVMPKRWRGQQEKPGSRRAMDDYAWARVPEGDGGHGESLGSLKYGWTDRKGNKKGEDLMHASGRDYRLSVRCRGNRHARTG